MIKLVLAIFLCCVGLCLGQGQQSCVGSPFLDFKSFSRNGSVKISGNDYKGIGPGDPARAVYKRHDNKPFTVIMLSAKVHNARKVKLHAVGSEDRKYVGLTNVTDIYLPSSFVNFLMKKLVFNVRADDKTSAALLNDITIEGCLPPEETSASSNTQVPTTTPFLGR